MRDQGISTITSDIYTSIVAVADSVERERPDIAAHAAPDGTVTIMFSDIEDSTVLTERLGDQAWQELLRKHNALIREQLQAHDGYEVKTMGDGFMVAFQSAKKGLDCAIAIQRAFDGHNASDGGAREGPHRPARGRGDQGGRRLLRQERHPRVARRRQGQRRRDPGVVAAARAGRSSVGAVTFGEPREVELKGLKGKHLIFEVVWAKRGLIKEGGLSWTG